MGHTKRVSNIFVTKNNLLVSGSHDCTIRTWNIKVSYKLFRMDKLNQFIKRPGL